MSEFEGQAREAIAIVDPEVELVGRLASELAHVPETELFTVLERMSTEQPLAFNSLSLIICGIYLYSNEFLQGVGYPLPHRNAPPDEQIVDELESGILEPVIARGKIYRS